MIDKKETRCIKCQNKLTSWNTSKDKELCNKCYKSPFEEGLKGLLWLAFIIFIIWIIFFSGGGSNDSSTSSNKPAPFQAEVNIFSEQMINIINRNDYTWTNMKVIANDYYACVEEMTLEPNEKWTLQTLGCLGVMGPLLEKIEIITDQGSQTEYFTYGTIQLN